MSGGGGGWGLFGMLIPRKPQRKKKTVSYPALFCETGILPALEQGGPLSRLNANVFKLVTKTPAAKSWMPTSTTSGGWAEVPKRITIGQITI